ncbi:MAG: hypothetical protein E7H57_12710, partial [Pantoea sp.]|nr:hypothetical protein [Pantoea sp.]
DFKGKTLWVYGGGGCSPEGRPENKHDILKISEATKSCGWDGVDFDDECNMYEELTPGHQQIIKEGLWK